MSGEFTAGQRLTQDKLSKLLGVSTMPVREALLRLAAEGLIVAEPNRSFSVVAISVEDVRDSYWVYGQIVGELAARACRIADQSMVDDLTRLHRRHDAAIDAEDRFQANWEFHRVVNAAGGSKRMLQILRSTLNFFPYMVSVPGSVELASSWQQDLIDAFTAKDVRAARTVSQQHARGAAELYVTHRTASEESDVEPAHAAPG
jgi:DNA-binding GntR family transcriptional regulator